MRESRLTTKSLAAAVAEFLRPSIPSAFRYYKSYEHFRDTFGGGVAYVQINAITHDLSTYHLAFYLSVRIDEVEALIKRIWAEDEKVGHYDRSIWCYTVNIGPGSPHWDYRIRGDWSFGLEDTITERHGPAVVEFVNDLALPYVEHHRDPASIRATLLDDPGRALNMYPFEQVLAIDLLGETRTDFEADVEALSVSYSSFTKSFRERFDEFVSRARRLS